MQQAPMEQHDLQRFRNASTSSDERDPFRSGNYNISPDSLGSNISPNMEPMIPEHLIASPASSSAPGSLLRGSMCLLCFIWQRR